MSKHLKQFLKLLANNSEVKKKAMACNELGKEKGLFALIALANENGITLSEADFAVKSSHSEELDISELEVVGGKVDCYCTLAGGGTDSNDKATYGCACVGYGQGGNASASDANCICAALGEGQDSFDPYPNDNVFPCR